MSHSHLKIIQQRNTFNPLLVCDYICEACIGVLGIQDICHFTSRDIGYFPFTSRDIGYCIQYFGQFEGY